MKYRIELYETRDAFDDQIIDSTFQSNDRTIAIDINDILKSKPETVIAVSREG